MAGLEDKRATAGEGSEPGVIRTLRWWRIGFELVFPPIVFTLAVVATPILFVTGYLADPQQAGVWAGLLTALAGGVWRLGRR